MTRIVRACVTEADPSQNFEATSMDQSYDIDGTSSSELPLDGGLENGEEERRCYYDEYTAGRAIKAGLNPPNSVQHMPQDTLPIYEISLGGQQLSATEVIPSYWSPSERFNNSGQRFCNPQAVIDHRSSAQPEEQAQFQFTQMSLGQQDQALPLDDVAKDKEDARRLQALQYRRWPGRFCQDQGDERDASSEPSLYYPQLGLEDRHGLELRQSRPVADGRGSNIRSCVDTKKALYYTPSYGLETGGGLQNVGRQYPTTGGQDYLRHCGLSGTRRDYVHNYRATNRYLDPNEGSHDYGRGNESQFQHRSQAEESQNDIHPRQVRLSWTSTESLNRRTGPHKDLQWTASGPRDCMLRPQAGPEPSDRYSSSCTRSGHGRAVETELGINASISTNRPGPLPHFNDSSRDFTRYHHPSAHPVAQRYGDYPGAAPEGDLYRATRGLHGPLTALQKNYVACDHRHPDTPPRHSSTASSVTNQQEFTREAGPKTCSVTIDGEIWA